MDLRSLNPCYLRFSFIDILMPRVMVLEGGAFMRLLGHEGRALMKGISTLRKEAQQRSLAPSTSWGHRNKSPACNLGNGLPQNSTMLLPWPWAFSLRNYEKQIPVVYKAPRFALLLGQPERLSCFPLTHPNGTQRLTKQK